MKNKIPLSKSITFLVLLILLSTGAVFGQSPTDIPHEDALKAVLAAKKKAEQMDVLVNIAVVDAGANLKAFVRMDGSYLGSIDVAIKKAKTSRYFDINTGDLGKLTQPGALFIILNFPMTDSLPFQGEFP